MQQRSPIPHELLTSTTMAAAIDSMMEPNESDNSKLRRDFKLLQQQYQYLKRSSTIVVVNLRTYEQDSEEVTLENLVLKANAEQQRQQTEDASYCKQLKDDNARLRSQCYSLVHQLRDLLQQENSDEKSNKENAPADNSSNSADDEFADAQFEAAQFEKELRKKDRMIGKLRDKLEDVRESNINHRVLGNEAFRIEAKKKSGADIHEMQGSMNLLRSTKYDIFARTDYSRHEFLKKRAYMHMQQPQLKVTRECHQRTP